MLPIHRRKGGTTLRWRESTTENPQGDSEFADSDMNEDLDKIFAILTERDGGGESGGAKYESCVSLRMKIASLLKASGDLDLLSEVS